MGKVKFIYIGKTMEYRIPKTDFCALRLSAKDKRKLYPTWDEKSISSTNMLCPFKTGEEEVFVTGIGWKNVGKKNWINVPLFSGEIEDWDGYIEKYGRECMFYSLTGYSLSSNDSCASNLVSEFLSLMQCEGGIVNYQKYVEGIEKMQEIQTRVFKGKLSFMTEYGLKSFIEHNMVRPCFRVFVFITTPYLDTPNDDEKMECFYRTYRNHEIKESHPDYARMVELEELVRKEAAENIYTYTKDYFRYKEELNEIRNRIDSYAVEVLSAEMEEGEKNVFPICMSDRVKFLFGEECHRIYSQILQDFGA